MSTHQHYSTFSAGFPDTWTTTPFEHKFVDALYKYFFGDKPGIKVNTIWQFSPFILPQCVKPKDLGLTETDKISQIRDYITCRSCDRVLFFETADQMRPEWQELFEYAVQLLGKQNVKVVGNIWHDTEYSQYVPFWLLATGEFFKSYLPGETDPATFENVFLSYNRKPHFHRVKTFLNFQNNQCLDLGVYTLGQNKEDTSWKGIKTFKGNDPGLTAIVHEDDHTYGIQCDPFSLGNIQVWRHSFLNIVHETLGPIEEEEAPHPDYPLITEKTFKPMIGKRPFISVAQPNYEKTLKKLGFELFDELPSDPVEAVKFCAKQNLKNFYKELKPKIDHNYNKFWQLNESLRVKYIIR